MSYEVTVEPGLGRRTPIGTKRDAIAAFAGEAKWCGEGGSKVVYKAGDVVYKVPSLEWCPQARRGEDCEGDHDRSEHNYSLDYEFEHANATRAQGHTWAAPTSRYVINGITVLAQYAYTVADKLWNEDTDRYYQLEHVVREKAYSTYLVGDMHSGNWGITAKGHVRVFDGFRGG